jgi:tRNA nucleotidyltransferase (CCA-adding enzyme)
MLPELAAQFAGSAGTHASMVLDAAAARELGLAARYALIAMRADEAAISALCDRLRVPQDCRELALLAARYHVKISDALALHADAVLRLLQATDALRRPSRFMQLLEICALDKLGAEAAPFPPGDWLKAALAAAQAVDAGAIAQGSRDAARIQQRVAQARLAAIRSAKGARPKSTPALNQRKR